MQKTADEMRIRCWGSDVCSSDLIPKADRDALLREEAEHAAEEAALRAESDDDADVLDADEDMLDRFDDDAAEIDDSEPGDDGDGDDGDPSAETEEEDGGRRRRGRRRRSEEHTSELQSLMRRSYAISCLKKNKHTTHP